MAEVDRALALDGLDAAQIHLARIEQPNSPPHQLRHDMQYTLGGLDSTFEREERTSSMGGAP